MVAIKGMIMPRCCGNCALVRYHDTLGYSCKSKGVEILQDEVLHKRADDCPLVEIEERKVGKWIKIGDRGFGTTDTVICKCSECDKVKEFTGKFDGHSLVVDMEYADKYCPNCGAEMRGSENE